MIRQNDAISIPLGRWSVPARRIIRQLLSSISGRTFSQFVGLKIWADAAYRGQELAKWCQATGEWELEVVERPAGTRGLRIVQRNGAYQESLRAVARVRQAQVHTGCNLFLTTENVGSFNQCVSDLLQAGTVIPSALEAGQLRQRALFWMRLMGSRFAVSEGARSWATSITGWLSVAASNRPWVSGCSARDATWRGSVR